MKKRYKLLAALVLTSTIGFSQTATLPLTEDFESESQGSTSCAQSTTINLASTVFSNGTGDDSDWSPDKGGTGSSNTGPGGTSTGGTDHNPGTSAGYYLYIETSGCYSKTTNLESTYMNWSTLAGVKVDFWYHMYGADMGTMHFDIRQGNGAWQMDFIPSWTDNLDVWQLQSISVFDPNYVGKDSVQIRVRGISGTGFGSDMALDDFSISAISGLDLEATALSSPSIPACAGSYPFALDVTNMGTDTVTSFKSYFAYNGSLVDSVTYAGSLYPGASTTITFGSQLIAAGSNSVMMYTTAPNGGVDGDLTNDTLSLSLSPAKSGVYTIDANGTASATTYTSFQSFINDLVSDGICGPITVNVAPNSGPYNEQVIFRGISGTSSTNTLTINGGGNTIQYGSTNSSERGAVTIDGMTYMTIDSLNVNGGSGTYGYGVVITGTSEYITYKNSRIDVGAQATSSFFTGVALTGSTSSPTTSSQVNHISIENNTIVGGYYGVTAYGTSGSEPKGNRIVNNIIEDVYYYSIYFAYQDSLVVDGNDISRPTKTTVSTMYALYATTGNKNLRVNANRIHNSHGAATSLTGAVYAIYVSSDATAGNENYFTNNLVYDINSNGTVYAVYDLGADGANYLNNTIVLDDNNSTGGTIRGFYQSSASSNSSFINNIISINRTGSGAKHGIYLNNTSTSMSVNYNNVFLGGSGSGSEDYGYFTSNQANLATWQTNTSFGANSFEADPMFTNPAAANYQAGNGILNDVAMSSPFVTTDITGAVRSANPDIGAYEFTPPADNAGVTAMVTPSLPICPGTYTPEVVITNLGANNLTSVKLFWSFNGVLDSLTHTATIAPSNSDTVSTSSITFNGTTAYDLVFYTKRPNGTTDSDPSNDTLSLIGLRTGLSGTYTIDPGMAASGSNFISFATATAAIGTYGLCGPITFNVAPGTYTTPVTIESINGASAINTITFDGGDSSATVITHNAASQYGTVIFDGASYITFKNLGIVSTGASNAVGVMFVNSHHITVSNCSISALAATSSSVISVLYGGSLTSTFTAGSNHYITFENNKVDGGYYGLRLYGTSGDYGKNNKILNNEFINAYYYGLYAYYQDSTEISGNKIDVMASNNTNADGLYAYYTFNADFIGNTISAPDYGLYVSQITTTRPSRTKKTRLINNMIHSTGDFGFYLYGVDSVDFLHNTVVAEGTNPAVYINTSTSSSYDPIDNYDIRNNIMYSLTSEAIEFLNSTDTIADKFDNNIYYTGGSVLVKIGTTTYADLLTYQSANSLMNAASLEGDPGFLSTTDFHVVGALANDAGDNSVGITTDIDGETRPALGSTTVDIGADEFTPPQCLPVANASFVNPSLDSVTIFWDGVGTSYQYELLLAGNAQGSGSFHLVNSDSVRIGGLTASTQYEYYVREICGRGDTSFWVGPIKFGTAIGVPYFQDFENFVSGNTGPTLDEGWITVNASPQWTTMASKGTQVSSSNTSPYYDNTNYGTIGGMFVYLETSTSAGTSDLISPPVYIDPSYTNVLFEFAYHMYGAAMGTLEVLVDTNGVQTSLWSLTGQQQTAGTDPWVTVPLNLVGYQGKSLQLIFRGTRGSSFTSDMGVDDIRLSVVAPLNAGVLEVQSPQLPICPGTITPVVGVKNFGTDTINSVDVIFVANGVHDTTSYVGQILPGDTASVTLSSTSVSNGVLYDLMFYTDMPNNMADAVPGDDTLSFNGLRTGLSGSFTIDTSMAASATNWHSFNAFAADISNYGLCGPITVDVAPATYNEQVEIMEVTGASATNTVTINGHGANLNYASTNSNERAVLTFNKASYITVDSLNIDASAGAYGHGIQNFGGAHHITIQNCTIDVGAQNTSSFFAGIVNSGSKSSATTSGGNMHHITVDNCRIIGGYYGITSYGNTANNDQHNFVITNNTIEDVYYSGVYMLYTDTALIEGNDVSRPTKTSVTTMYGYFISAGTQNAIFNANTVHNTHGAASSKTGAVYAFYVAADATVGNENYITNNIIYDINSDGTVYAIYDLGADGAQYINNTISLDHVASTGGLTRGLYQSSASNNSSFVNNLITISRGGSGVKHGIYLNNTSTSMSVDYNNVYLNSQGTGAQNYGRFTSDQATLLDWQTNTSFGANSHDVDPKYNNLPAFDLTPSSGLINSVGLPNAMVTTDYYGVTRAAIPDIGAIEFNPPASNNLGFASLTAPIVSVDSCYGATEDVIVSVINAGGVPLDFSVDNATITMNVTGAITQTLTVNVNNNTANGGSPLAIGTVVDINMGTINMTTAGSYNFNGLITMATDTFPQNDTLNDTQVLLPVTGGVLSGLDTICSGDTVTITTDNYVGQLQWQVFNNGVWTDISGATTDELAVTPLSLTDYRVLACGTVPSDTISILPISLSAPTATGGITAAISCNVVDSVYATASSTNVNPTFDWYDAATGGNKITTGGNYWVSADGDSLKYKDTPQVNNPAYDTVWVEEVTNGGAGGSSLLITEFDAGSPDALEIQNVSSKPVDVTGWSVAVSDDYSLINDANSIVQTLSGTMAPGQLMNWSDATGSNYWGNNLFWNPGSGGWIVLIDNQGNVVDFVVWDWTANDIAGMSLTVNGFAITPGANWIGAGITGSGAFSRVGTEDNDDVSDFVVTPVNMGTSNPGLILPFPGGGCTSVRVPAYLAIDCTIGIDNVEAISSFNVSPNPSTGLFKMSFATTQNENLNLYVRDVAGKVVYKDMLHVNGNFTKELDFSNFAKGVYFLQIQSGNNTKVEKLIIK